MNELLVYQAGSSWDTVAGTDKNLAIALADEGPGGGWHGGDVPGGWRHLEPRPAVHA